MDPIVQALAEQQAELAGLLRGLDGAGWHAPTRCEGWYVSDVVLHLAQSDELAIGSCSGSFETVMTELTSGLPRASSIDESVASMVESQRSRPFTEVLDRWRSDAEKLVEILGGMDLSVRVAWVAGQLTARTLATTRLAECWIHSGDVALAVGADLAVTDRLHPIARLAWRTLPYAFASAGLAMAGPVAFRLTSPSDEEWEFAPDQPALTTISGRAIDLCNVAARRVDPSTTSLSGEGPDTANVLRLVRTYA